MKLITPLARARGLGSAKEGVSHWWAQRLTAIALVPLVVWLIYSVVSLLGADQQAVRAWIGNGLNATFLIALLIALFYHLQLGMQVVIEDYVHGRATEVTLQIIVKFASILGALAGVLGVLKISLGSA